MRNVPYRVRHVHHDLPVEHAQLEVVEEEQLHGWPPAAGCGWTITDRSCFRWVATSAVRAASGAGPAPATPRRRRPLGRRLSGGADLDLRALHQARLAIGHHALVGSEALRD